MVCPTITASKRQSRCRRCRSHCVGAAALGLETGGPAYYEGGSWHLYRQVTQYITSLVYLRIQLVSLIGIQLKSVIIVRGCRKQSMQPNVKCRVSLIVHGSRFQEQVHHLLIYNYLHFPQAYRYVQIRAQSGGEQRRHIFQANLKIYAELT